MAFNNVLAVKMNLALVLLMVCGLRLSRRDTSRRGGPRGRGVGGEKCVLGRLVLHSRGMASVSIEGDWES